MCSICPFPKIHKLVGCIHFGLLDNMLFHRESTYIFLVKNPRIITENTKNDNSSAIHLPQAHQTRQRPYTTSNISEPYWTSRMPSPMLWRHQCLHPVCRKQAIAIALPVNQPQQDDYVSQSSPSLTFTLPASAAIAPPTVKALS